MVKNVEWHTDQKKLRKEKVLSVELKNKLWAYISDTANVNINKPWLHI